MQQSISVCGVIQFEGDPENILSILESRGYIMLLTLVSSGLCQFNGACRSTAENFQQCLNEVAENTRLHGGQIRCYGNDPGQVSDLILVGDKFVSVPLELQPTLDALDDPLIREYYGIDFCVASTHT